LALPILGLLLWNRITLIRIRRSQLPTGRQRHQAT
jgi:hypothetical protein